MYPILANNATTIFCLKSSIYRGLHNIYTINVVTCVKGIIKGDYIFTPNNTLFYFHFLFGLWAQSKGMLFNS